MSRGGSYGGGQSSLGYLFGSKEGQPENNPPPSPSKIVNPPYGTDIQGEKPSSQKLDNNNYHRAQGQNSGNFITVSKSILFFELSDSQSAFRSLSN